MVGGAVATATPGFSVAGGLRNSSEVSVTTARPPGRAGGNVPAAPPAFGAARPALPFLGWAGGCADRATVSPSTAAAVTAHRYRIGTRMVHSSNGSRP